MTTIDTTTYFARNTYTELVDGQTEFQYAFSGGTPIASGHVEVDVDIGGGWELKSKTDTTFGWLINFTNSTITFNSAPKGRGATGVRVRRKTPVGERLADWTSGSALGEVDLDTDSLQMIYGIQEIVDTFLDAMVLSDVDGRWEARGIEVRRSSDATQLTSLVTLGQVMALIGSGGNAQLNNPITIHFNGSDFDIDGYFNLRTLSGDNTINSLLNGEVQCWIENERVYHEDYSIIDGYKVNFTGRTPAYGDRLMIQLLPATVIAVYEKDLVDTEAIRDNAVTSSKILDGTISTADLADGLITVAKLGLNSVTTAAINDGAVTTSKMADGAATDPKVAVGINGSPGYASASLTKADVFTSVQGSTTKLREVSLGLRVTAGPIRHEYIMEVSNDSSFTSSSITAWFTHTTDENNLYTYKGLVPASWYWRLQQVSGPGSPETDNNVTLVGVTYCDLTH